MVYGQIDPARLHGDALRCWYSRSPAEIDHERGRAADQTYERFFSPLRTETGPSVGGGAPSRLATKPGHVQLAAAAKPGFWDYWGVPGCANCHGYSPDTLPPVGVHPMAPPGDRPGDRNSTSAATPRLEWSNKPECNQQFEEDRKICQKAKSSVCWENSNLRLGNCSRDNGRLGNPRLEFGPRGR